MIVITGTKRSGTSMCMQILQAGGLEVLGTAFTNTSKETISEANQRGFYESRLRRGVYYATNPNPETGEWICPQESQNTGVKIFIPGVLRSDVAYLNRVVATVRPWEQYVKSLERLYLIERQGHAAKGTKEFLSPHLDPVLEWWTENFLLLRDLTTRKYPVRVISYEAMLKDPEKMCVSLFQWFGVGDAMAGMQAVHPEDRTQVEQSSEAPRHRFAEVFEDLHDRVFYEKAFDDAFLTKMNDTHLALMPEIEAALEQLGGRTRRLHSRRVQAHKEGRLGPKRDSVSNSLSPYRLDALLHSEASGVWE